MLFYERTVFGSCDGCSPSDWFSQATNGFKKFFPPVISCRSMGRDPKGQRRSCYFQCSII